MEKRTSAQNLCKNFAKSKETGVRNYAFPPLDLRFRVQSICRLKSALYVDDYDDVKAQLDEQQNHEHEYSDIKTLEKL
ncbi:hypothetical protein Baya_16959 [Bagarius yarrelli]|uniref:Uncharacterized protein n=1 Tax=Bagarius yarrelli TaxID=175774 RepID=A0A556VX05_BAGYA|nr:hypothetical protein Baya_16959 [Bagarius yarrelli]